MTAEQFSQLQAQTSDWYHENIFQNLNLNISHFLTSSSCQVFAAD